MMDYTSYYNTLYNQLESSCVQTLDHLEDLTEKIGNKVEYNLHPTNNNMLKELIEIDINNSRDILMDDITNLKSIVEQMYHCLGTTMFQPGGIPIDHQENYQRLEDIHHRIFLFLFSQKNWSLKNFTKYLINILKLLQGFLKANSM